MRFILPTPKISSDLKTCFWKIANKETQNVLLTNIFLSSTGVLRTKRERGREAGVYSMRVPSQPTLLEELLEELAERIRIREEPLSDWTLWNTENQSATSLTVVVCSQKFGEKG